MGSWQSMERPGAMVAMAALAGALVACGGGSDGGAPAPAPAAPPASGSYAWLLKAEGSTAALRYGLSLLHPSTPDVEWVIEPANEVVTDARSIAAGTVDATALRTGALTPRALVYIVGGDVRRVALQADGSEPRASVKRAQSTSACRIVLEAIDHGAIEASRFIASTAGADGLCDTLDDGRGEVRLDATLGVVFAPWTGAAPLAALRDPATLAPRGWLTATEAKLWSPAPGASFTVRDTTQPITAVVAATHRSVLVESASGLSLIDFTGGTSFTETPLPAAGTGGGWKSIGYDAANHYVYRNSDGTRGGTWSVVRIARTLPAVTVLAGGNGTVATVGMGRAQLYATVFRAGANDLLRISKLVPQQRQTVETGPEATVTTVVTSGQSVHQLWRVTGVGSAVPGYSVQMIDETGTILYTSNGGGFPIATVEAASVDFATSENRSTFLLAEGYNARAYSGASLLAYDTVARQARTIGTLAGAAEFGADFVFASAAAGPDGRGAAFAGRSTAGNVAGSGMRVYYFDATAASSLRSTTLAQ